MYRIKCSRFFGNIVYGLLVFVMVFSICRAVVIFDRGRVGLEELIGRECLIIWIIVCECNCGSVDCVLESGFFFGGILIIYLYFYGFRRKIVLLVL